MTAQDNPEFLNKKRKFFHLAHPATYFITLALLSYTPAMFFLNFPLIEILLKNSEKQGPFKPDDTVSIFLCSLLFCSILITWVFAVLYFIDLRKLGKIYRRRFEQNRNFFLAHKSDLHGCLTFLGWLFLVIGIVSAYIYCLDCLNKVDKVFDLDQARLSLYFLGETPEILIHMTVFSIIILSYMIFTYFRKHSQVIEIQLQERFCEPDSEDEI